MKVFSVEAWDLATKKARRQADLCYENECPDKRAYFIRVRAEEYRAIRGWMKGDEV